MKHALLILLAFSMLLCLCACSLGSSSDADHVTFYYCREDFAYNTQPGVIGSEERYVSSHGDNLMYLLPLYLTGPMDEELTSLFPKQVQLMSVEVQADRLVIALSDAAEEMEESRFTLACACLTMTCLELTDCVTVEITSGERSVTMNRENLLLQDTIVAEQPTTEETQ